ncbi:hypothetical protein AURANDRAFT_22083 [Aureococcus anophagefferens]|uniref:Nucleolar GTP-binding protein 1 n=1 Tax=Aureococcus anophagefferens TaxID=44056 RepID=F0Y285_AURAN|nr:hypothetical protein AURANDRAFT_22083 [Aureococcus anophagefferens]EGB11113.1 hypothetical protein AURANDRAFT_22083 [Aureococcus anophagefferens]|eukprot:XP_009034662.1 hypothetical protein AURANDRAFT_22083 [Aureococcus anophagefferens]
MPVYDLKRLAAVPSASELVDIVLMRTQRKTPTVVHPGYKITRIRSFYMRKVKFTQQTISERLGAIVQDFPRLDDVHPFHSDLMGVLYDRDHYKLALGQLNTCKKLCETVTRDYVRLIKYADSLYRCKSLKVAALGRMMTLLKRQRASLGYLEEVRKHLGRLPALDPSARTLLVCGFPNVGKSSFMNKVTRAEVEVQPYAFTTKSLYVGHMDHRYLRWQVIDTPGILDHELEKRNVIEMQAVTALAHLPCAVLFFVDVSEQCGYTIEQQSSLFHSIRALFADKQLVLVANKTDAKKVEDLDAGRKQLLEDMLSAHRTNGPGGDEMAKMVEMSNVTEQGVADVKNLACDLLLAHRVEKRRAYQGGARVRDRLNRLHGTTPDAVEDIRKVAAAARSEADAAEARVAKAAPRPTERDVMWRNGGPGVYSADLTREYIGQLKCDEWRTDLVPEIMDGKNVLDFVDEDIVAKLALLDEDEAEAEEGLESAAREAAHAALSPAELALVTAVRDKKVLNRRVAQAARGRRNAPVPRQARLRSEGAAGNDEDDATVRGRAKSAAVKRTRSLSRPSERDGRAAARAEAMDVDGDADANPAKKQKRSASRGDAHRSQSRPPPRDEQGLNEADQDAAREIGKKMQKKMNRMARSGEADRKTGPKLIRWMNEGKMGRGARNCR